MAEVQIHPTALVAQGAELDEGVQIGPFCTVSAQARIGARTRLVSHVVIEGSVRIGRENELHPFSVIGAAPQDLTYKGDPTRVEIGDKNIFREMCTIHRGTVKGGGVTSVGNENFMMATTHLAHDAKLGNKVIMANYAGLAGHAEVQDNAYIGGQSVITQFCRVGPYCFVAANTVIRRDLPPYLCAKDFSEVSGPNLVGLKRAGLADEDVQAARSLYKILYLEARRTEEALNIIQERFPASSSFVQRFVDFIKSSKMGVQR